MRLPAGACAARQRQPCRRRLVSPVNTAFRRSSSAAAGGEAAREADENRALVQAAGFSPGGCTGGRAGGRAGERAGERGG